jgi:hypothetical protein
MRVNQLEDFEEGVLQLRRFAANDKRGKAARGRSVTHTEAR